MKKKLIILDSLEGCKLAIGSYPHFVYDARGGGGKTSLVKVKNKNHLFLIFNPDTFSIPSLNWRTTRFLSIPMPLGLEIKMLLEKLEGTIALDTGEICLDFESEFLFTIWPIFVFPKLTVKTFLKSSRVVSKLFDAEGKCWGKDGKATLVGIAVIPKTGHKLLDLFLSLPNEALAKLECRITNVEI